MTKRRTHSSIDTLPAAVRDAMTAMVVDGAWPADYPGRSEGRPTYEDIVAFADAKGHCLSRSAVGRWAKGLRVIERMRTAGLIARETMAGLTAEDAPKTQKAAAEMATALLLDYMTEHENYSSKELKEVAQAVRDCALVSIKADTYARDAVAARLKKADEEITKIGDHRKIDPETLKMIREQIYGIVT